MKRQILISLLIALSFSCSVKEDRSSCPCVLYVHASNELPEGDVLLCVSSADGSIREGIVSRDAVLSGQACMTVGRGEARITMLSGIRNMASGSDGSLKIPVGYGCDSIRAFSERSDIEGEIFHYSGTLHKDYAELRVCFSGVGDDAQMALYGDVDGFSNVDKSPSKGVFSCNALKVENSSEYLVCLPRQIGKTLSMSVSGVDGYSREIPIGTMIVNSGYDWTSEDLLDIKMTVDLSASRIEIGIADWNCVEYQIVEV